MLTRIALCCIFFTSIFGKENVFLATPKISKEDVIGTNVGIRPFRKTGIRIEAECVEDKLIIHNYGYGGSGLTLAFGGALEILDILKEYDLPPQSVAILGGGVVGLATAFDLLSLGFDVHIYADKLSPDLTSNVAAGIWTPLSFPDDLPEEKQQLHNRMEKNAAARFSKSLGENPEFAGVKIIPCYSFKRRVTAYKDAKEREEIIAHFDNGVIKEGKRKYEMHMDGQVFINDLFSKVKQKGAVIHQVHLESIEDILDLKEPIIINCTSMGSIQLFNDQQFMPVRGQLVYFAPQKGMDYLYFQSVDNPDDSNSYFVSIYPWSDRIILGGVYEYGETDPIVSQDVIDKLIENAQKSLSAATVLD